MLPPSALSALTDTIRSLSLPDESIRQRVRQIHADVLAHSRYIREPDFAAIHPWDLEFLFGSYDGRFLGGLCRRALEGRAIRFRLSSRMTQAGGKTTRFRTPAGIVSYEISIGSSMLFDGFGTMDRRITVCGLECENRLEALQRIFEHEFVHLAELLCWENSDCTAARFQDIAQRFFLHRAHTHNLITRQERAAASGIRPGSPVAFIYQGRRLTGRANRITKRVTVLVEDPDGPRYSDGLRYKTYYVPIEHLEPV